jgi:hypothetical protein
LRTDRDVRRDTTGSIRRNSMSASGDPDRDLFAGQLHIDVASDRVPALVIDFKPFADEPQ